MKTPLEHIHDLREKPVHVRERVAAFATVAITGLIFLGWLGTANRQLTFMNREDEAALAAASADVDSLASPVAALRDSFSALFSGFQDMKETGEASTQ